MILGLARVKMCGSKENVPRRRFRGVNDPHDISNNLALGQPWLSELGHQLIRRKFVDLNLGFTRAVTFMGIVL